MAGKCSLNIRRGIHRICISLLLIAVSLSCRKGREEYLIYDTAQSLVFKDVAYGQADRQKMNVFLPSGRNEDTKMILFIHGGGWTSGDKNDFDTFASAYTAEGIGAITINYRYADIYSGIDYTEMLDDIGKAISCLTDSSVLYSINTRGICLLGHSAGGHLALLYAYRNNDEGLVDKVISLAGPTDLTDSGFLAIPGVRELVSILTGNDPGKLMDASPIHHLNDVTTYLYHGKSDVIVPYQQSERLFEKIRSLNSLNYCSLIEGCGHGFNLNEFSRIASETIALIKNE